MEELKNKLSELKSLGCSGIKISFEDEGALLNEVMTMRYLTSSLGLELSLKIGGCEAKRDIMDAIHLGCDTIVAPMIESEFALTKFINAVEKSGYKNKISCNIETLFGFQNFLNMKNLKRLNSITFGRVDFVESHDSLSRDSIDDPYMYDVAHDIFLYTRLNGLLCNMGGGINIHSKQFIQDLIDDNKLDYFETRYVIFKTSNVNMEQYSHLLKLANEFEVTWLKYIRSRYQFNALKDDSRIRMIEKRIEENRSTETSMTENNLKNDLDT